MSRIEMRYGTHKLVIESFQPRNESLIKMSHGMSIYRNESWHVNI